MPGVHLRERRDDVLAVRRLPVPRRVDGAEHRGLESRGFRIERHERPDARGEFRRSRLCLEGPASLEGAPALVDPEHHDGGPRRDVRIVGERPQRLADL